jgi:excisionase family DNA binding protein
MAARPRTQIEVHPERLAVSVNQAAEAAGISRSSLYEEMAAGRLKFAKVGARRVILVDDLREWLASLRVA